MMRPRAFSLVIVVVLGVAAFVVATTLLAVSEAARTRVAHSVQGDQAAAIAEAGMERARAYLQGATAAAVDFDLVLDPDLEANCSGLPSSPPTASAGSQVLRPKLGDGVAVTYRGKSWTRVAYGEGAYLIRFEDDGDDFRPQTAWDDYTGNTPGGTACNEGPTALGTADNPFRDRNQTITVTVIGIAPGTDPDRAVHRSTLRRLETFPGTAVVAGIQVRGNINVAGNADLFACSPIASMQVDGTLTGDGSGSGCACGESRADSVSSEWDHCTATSACGGVGCLPGTLETPGPSVPTVLPFTSGAGPDFYFDWSVPTATTPGSCIFRVDRAGPGGLWWWDPEALRGPGNVPCATFEGTATSIPPINPADATGFGRCWTPILVGLATTRASVFVGAQSELAGSAWTPKDTPASDTGAAVNARLSAAGYPTFAPVPAAITKPDWKRCVVLDHPTATPVGCTTCDDGLPVPVMDGSASDFWFTGDTTAELKAIPAGVYIFVGNIDLTGGPEAMSAPAPPTATMTLTDWPLATVAVDGNMQVNTRTILGVGQKGAAFPSVILTGNLDIVGGSDLFIGGSVWALGNWRWAGSTDNFFFGELHLNGNWEMSGTSSFNWRYFNQLSNPTILVTPTAPTQHRSLD